MSHQTDTVHLSYEAPMPNTNGAPMPTAPLVMEWHTEQEKKSVKLKGAQV